MPVPAGHLLWGGWLAMYFLTFSAGSVAGHTYYMGIVAVPLAALTGGAIAFMWRTSPAAAHSLLPSSQYFSPNPSRSEADAPARRSARRGTRIAAGWV